ncbi:MAG: DUF177 domain-containing protein [Oscillospiraceae bacterium]|nr:DUF177 domain-containing protein [Oscillospiraceae bacterium]
MFLKLTSILDRPGESLPFKTELNLSDMEFGGVAIVQEPVVVEGRVENRAGVLVMNASMETTLHCVCDRCLKPFLLPRKQEFSVIIVQEETDDMPVDAYPMAENECVDIDEIATTVFVLEMDSRFLCSPECKGLCHRCGKDLNQGPCDCKAEIDPRLAVLAQLLESQNKDSD